MYRIKSINNIQSIIFQILSRTSSSFKISSRYFLFSFLIHPPLSLSLYKRIISFNYVFLRIFLIFFHTFNTTNCSLIVFINILTVLITFNLSTFIDNKRTKLYASYLTQEPAKHASQDWRKAEIKYKHLNSKQREKEHKKAFQKNCKTVWFSEFRSVRKVSWSKKRLKLK